MAKLTQFFSIFVLNLLLSSLVLATTFAPLTVQQKVEDSDAVVFGEVTRSFYTKDKSGKVVTVLTLDVEKSFGLQSNQISAPKNFQVRYLGGVWEGVTHKIEGAPKVNIGEEVVFLLRYRHNVFWVHYLASGKFSRVTLDGKDYLRSEVFPDRPGVGIISLQNFEKVLDKSSLRSSFSYNSSDTSSEKKISIFKKKKIDREPATFKKVKDRAKYNNRKHAKSFIFIVFIFATLGVLFSLIVRSRRRN